MVYRRIHREQRPIHQHRVTSAHSSRTAPLHRAERNSRTGSSSMPSTIRGADSPHTTMRLRNGTSSASRRSPTRSRRATAPTAFTSIATLSPTTKSTSEPSAVRQKVSGRASRVYPSRALSSQKTSCSRARPNRGRPGHGSPSLLPCPESRNYSAGNSYLSAIELRDKAEKYSLLDTDQLFKYTFFVHATDATATGDRFMKQGEVQQMLTATNRWWRNPRDWQRDDPDLREADGAPFRYSAGVLDGLGSRRPVRAARPAARRQVGRAQARHRVAGCIRDRAPQHRTRSGRRLARGGSRAAGERRGSSDAA